MPCHICGLAIGLHIMDPEESDPLGYPQGRRGDRGANQSQGIGFLTQTTHEALPATPQKDGVAKGTKPF